MSQTLNELNHQLFIELASARQALASFNPGAGMGPESSRLQRKIDGIRARLIESNMGMVHTRACRYASPESPKFEDLMSAGVVGLIKAVDSFDHERGNQFSTHAYYPIWNAVYAECLAQKEIRLSAKKNADYLKIKQMAEDLYELHSIEPTAEMIAAELDMSLRMVKELLFLIPPVVSLDMEMESGSLFGDLVADETAADPFAEAVSADHRELIEELMAVLDEREKSVLATYYGLKNQPKRTYEEIGSILGMSGERARQILNGAIRKLKAAHARLQNTPASVEIIAQQVRECVAKGEVASLEASAEAPVAEGCVRVVKREADGENHHLWMNNGTWCINISVVDANGKVKRVRKTLRTKDAEVARGRRDFILGKLAAMSPANTCTVEQLGKIILRAVS